MKALAKIFWVVVGIPLIPMVLIVNWLYPKWEKWGGDL
jgi:hypothetical protein